MRAGSFVLAFAILVAFDGAALAQYPAPLIGGWLLPSQPVAPDTSGGKGDAQQHCTTIPEARGGSRVVCPSSPTTPGKK